MIISPATTVVQNVAFGDEDTTITYVTTSDVRSIANLPVVRTCQLTLPSGHPSYTEAGDLYEAALDLVRDVLEDFDDAQPWQPMLPFEDDDDD